MKITDLDGVQSKSRLLKFTSIAILLFTLTACGGSGSDDYSVETSVSQHTVMFEGGSHANMDLYMEGKDNIIHGEAAIIEIKRQLDARVAECSPELQTAAKNIAFVIVNDFCFKWKSGSNSGLAVGAYYPSMGMIKVSLYGGWRGNDYPHHNHAPHTLRDKEEMVAWSGGDTRWRASNFYSGKTYPSDGSFPMGKLMMVIEHELKHVVQGGYHTKIYNTAETTDEIPAKLDILETKGTVYNSYRVYDDNEGAWGYFHLPLDW